MTWPRWTGRQKQMPVRHLVEPTGSTQRACGQKAKKRPLPRERDWQVDRPALGAEGCGPVHPRYLGP